jgi:hypothetical protein
MGEIQKLTIDGKGYVLLSEDDYQDLVDVSDARAAKARIDAGEETWPEDVVKALIAGEDPVRVFRKHRGMSIKELAEKSGLSKSRPERRRAPWTHSGRSPARWTSTLTMWLDAYASPHGRTDEHRRS